MARYLLITTKDNIRQFDSKKLNSFILRLTEINNKECQALSSLIQSLDEYKAIHFVNIVEDCILRIDD